jgi:threonine dehydrogenase-like Zn-dependent dehydrogenase
MKAVAVLGKKDLRIVDVSKPSCPSDGVIVRVRASGICGSDLHVVNADLWTEALTVDIDGYRIIGHEFAGEIVEVGPTATRWQIGDRVTSVHNKGAMAEYVAVPANRLNDLYAVPPHVSYEIAATLEPLCTPVHAWHLRPARDGDTVAIFGSGVIGLGYLQVVKAYTKARTIVVDVSPFRLDVARKLGAEVTLNAREVDPVVEIKRLSGERHMRYHKKSSGECDIAVEAAGKSFTLDQAMEVVKPIDGAVIVAAGYEDSVPFDANQVTTKNIALLGSWGYTGGEPAEAFELITGGRAPRDLLVTHTFPLDQAVEAFRVQGDAGVSVKVVLVNH